MPAIRVNGVELYYEQKGKQGKSPIVLVHGSWGDHSNWDLVVPKLAEEFTVLTYDRRGHSKSEKVHSQGSGEQDASDLAELITKLGLSPAHVIGNSFGASIALKLAILNPNVIRGLSGHEPPLLGLIGGEALNQMNKRIEAVVTVIQKEGPEQGAKQFVETVAFGPGSWDKLPPRLRETFVNNVDTFEDEMRDPFGLTLDLVALAKFSKPTLLTHGGASPPFFIGIIGKLHGALPNSKVVVYPEAGHTPHLSHPNEFVRNVKAFVESQM